MVERLLGDPICFSSLRQMGPYEIDVYRGDVPDTKIFRKAGHPISRKERKQSDLAVVRFQQHLEDAGIDPREASVPSAGLKGRVDNRIFDRSLPRLGLP